MIDMMHDNFVKNCHAARQHIKLGGRHTRADGSDHQERAHEQQGCVDNYMTLTNTTTVQIHVL